MTKQQLHLLLLMLQGNFEIEIEIFLNGKLETIYMVQQDNRDLKLFPH